MTFASPKLRNDFNVALIAVRQNGLAIEFLSRELKRDVRIAFLAVRQNSDAFKLLDHDIRCIREIAALALSRDGLNLYYVKDKFGNDIDMVRLAVKQNPSALAFAGIKCRQILKRIRSLRSMMIHKHIGKVYRLHRMMITQRINLDMMLMGEICRHINTMRRY